MNSFCSSIRVVLTLFASAAILAAGYQDCSILNVYDQNAYSPGKSIAVRLFTLEGMPDYDDESIEDLRIFAVEKLKEELAKSGYFETVEIIADDVEPQADFVISATLSGLHEGNRWKRMAFATGKAEARLRGSISSPKGEVISDFECARGAAGGAIGAGGLIALAQSDKGLMRKNMSKFAASLAKSFKLVEKEMQKRADKAQKKKKPPEPLEGKSDDGAGEWRQVPVGEWRPKQHAKEVNTFIVGTNRKNWTEVDALWLTSSSYRSNLYLSNLNPTDGDPLEGGDLKQGFILDVEQASRFKGEDVYVLAVTYTNSAIKSGPLFWDSQEVLDNTYFCNASNPELRVRPTTTVDLESYLITRRFKAIGKVIWRSHPVLFAFPTKLPDGSPVVRSPFDEVELHSEIDGRPVIATFRLGKLEIPSVEDLKIASDDHAGQD